MGNLKTVCVSHSAVHAGHLEVVKVLVAAGADLSATNRRKKVRKRLFLRHLYIKCIILPRQARDKHRENSKKRGRFLADGAAARARTKACSDCADPPRVHRTTTHHPHSTQTIHWAFSFLHIICCGFIKPTLA